MRRFSYVMQFSLSEILTRPYPLHLWIDGLSWLTAIRTARTARRRCKNLFLSVEPLSDPNRWLLASKLKKIRLPLVTGGSEQRRQWGGPWKIAESFVTNLNVRPEVGVSPQLRHPPHPSTWLHLLSLLSISSTYYIDCVARVIVQVRHRGRGPGTAGQWFASRRNLITYWRYIRWDDPMNDMRTRYPQFR